MFVSHFNYASQGLSFSNVNESEYLNTLKCVYTLLTTSMSVYSRPQGIRYFDTRDAEILHFFGGGGFLLIRH